MISVFDIFKIGIGPSSSHTVGPMKAGKQFTDDLIARGLLADVSKVVVDVYGSLSLTGKGHHTDIAIIMGLAGNLPDTVDIDAIPGFIQDVNTHGRLMLANGQHEVDFPVDQCMNFHADNLSLHENGMRITALAGDKVIYSQTYYSIGGGFIVDEAHFGQIADAPVAVPYPYKNAADLQRHCRETGLSLSGLMMQNELALHSKEALEQHFAAVWEVMSAGIERGITTEGVLPGKLRVPRRAAALRRMLVSQDTTNSDPMAVVDWINMFALAVNEENAAGGRVVTAPTNGACGIVPAVLAYYDKFIRKVNSNSLARYMLVASAIGSLYKMNASISGAEVGCQGEVGVAYSFNWSIRISPDLQMPFDPTHENMANLKLSPDQPVEVLAADLRRAFSGIVAGNVKEVGIQAIEQYGPYKLHGDPEMMRRMDDLLQGFVAQHRMKLPGGTAYIPCYEIIA